MEKIFIVAVREKDGRGMAGRLNQTMRRERGRESKRGATNEEKHLWQKKKKKTQESKRAEQCNQHGCAIYGKEAWEGQPSPSLDWGVQGRIL